MSVCRRRLKPATLSGRWCPQGKAWGYKELCLQTHPQHRWRIRFLEDQALASNTTRTFPARSSGVNGFWMKASIASTTP
jgi:hypothetical protein